MLDTILGFNLVSSFVLLILVYDMILDVACRNKLIQVIVSKVFPCIIGVA